jgi:2-aminoethylphosphonate-pyruvate transaminase
MILLNPGPVNLSEGVRRALLRPDLCHREPEFAVLQTRIREGLLEVYGLDPTRWAAVLLTGSGTAAMEAMLLTLVPSEGRLLVIENGVYGERLRRIAQVQGIPFRALHHTWTASVDLDALERALSEDAFTHLAVVHHETTTGRLNDVGAVAARCRPHGVQLLLDAVSSYGAEAIEFDPWNIAGCVATANKCLHGIPGAAFAMVRRESLPAAGSAVRSLYLDLRSYLVEQDVGATPFTPSVQACYALDAALAELRDDGGRTARYNRYRALAHQVRTGLTNLGIEPLLPEDQSSVVLNAYHLPPGVGYEQLHDGLKEAGFVIYAGQGALAQRIFRISTMGAVTDADIRRFIVSMAQVIKARR